MASSLSVKAVQIKPALVDLLKKSHQKIFDLAQPAHVSKLQAIYLGMWYQAIDDSPEEYIPQRDEIMIWHRPMGEKSEAVVFPFPVPDESGLPYFIAAFKSQANETRVFVLEKSRTGVFSGKNAVLIEYHENEVTELAGLQDTSRDGFVCEVDRIMHGGSVQSLSKARSVDGLNQKSIKEGSDSSGESRDGGGRRHKKWWMAFPLWLVFGICGAHRYYMGWFLTGIAQSVFFLVMITHMENDVLERSARIWWGADFFILLWHFLRPVKSQHHLNDAEVSGTTGSPAYLMEQKTNPSAATPVARENKIARQGVQKGSFCLTVSVGDWRIQIPGSWQASRSEGKNTPRFTAPDGTTVLYLADTLNMRDDYSESADVIADKWQSKTGEALLREAESLWRVLDRKKWCADGAYYNVLDMLHKEKPFRLLNIVASKGGQIIHMQLHDHHCVDLKESQALVASIMSTLTWCSA